MARFSSVHHSCRFGLLTMYAAARCTLIIFVAAVRNRHSPIEVFAVVVGGGDLAG